MSVQTLDPDYEVETQDTFLLPPTVSDTENDVLNYNNLTTSPVITVTPWLGINSASKLWLHCECTYADGTPGIIELAEAVPVNNSTSASAFSCELPFDELAKLGDNTSITVILMVSTDGTRESHSLASARYSLMFQHPIILTNYSRWMTDIGPNLDHLRLSDLVMPQTHNAGVDQKGAGWPADQWAACQDDSFTYQLRSGARALDLRLYRDPKEMDTHKEFIFKHNGYHASRYLNDCIHGALAFAEQNPREIIILDFKVTELDYRVERVISTIEIVLGKHCIPRSATNYTIGQIRQRHPGRNIIVTFNHTAWFCWRRFTHSWTGQDNNTSTSLARHINNELAKPPSGNLHSMFACGFDWLGPTRFSNNAIHFQTFFSAIKSDVYRHPSKGNLIRVDFIAGTGVVDRCINATRERAKQATASAVRTLNASNITTHSIQLNWLAPQESATVINYQVREDGNLLATTTDTQYIATNLKDGTTYNFTVTANYASGQGAPALLTSTTIGVPDTTKPSQPTDLKIVYAGSSNLALLRWTAATDNIAVTRYEIYQNDTLLGTIDSKDTFFPITVNNPSMYKVRALDAAGNFQDSEPIFTHPDNTPPSKPTELQAIEIKAKSITLEWLPSTDNIAVAGYEIYRNDTLIDNISSTFYIDRNLNEDTSYQYRVRALDDRGNFSDSDPLTIRTKGWPPSVPGNFRASAITNETVTLEWNSSSGTVPIAGYEIRNGALLLATVTTNRFQVLDLDSNTTYSFSIVARDTSGNHSDSAVIWVTTEPESNVPTELRLFRELNTGNYSWKPPLNSNGVTGYQISLDGVVLRELSDTFATLTLKHGVIHLFEVRARRNGVLSDPASISG